MKYNKTVLITLFILCSFLLCSCKKEEIKEEPIDLGNLEQTIYVVSDIHLLSNNLINEALTKDMLVSDGRCQELDYDLVNALVKKVNSEKPNYLIITGDLTFNGELDSHKELISLLDKITDTKVLVIPGNHDTYNLRSYSYIDKVINYTETITDSDFIELYKNYGYDSYISKDETTNSYIYPLSENKWAFMLDTNLCRYNFEEGTNLVGGYIYGETYDWMEEYLKYAQDNNIEVISFSHHNLITHNPMFESNYTLRDHIAIRELYLKYNVNINFSGHLHIQNIQELDGFYDIASVGLLDYGCRYGEFKIYDKGYSYNAYNLELDNINLQEYSFNVFYNRYFEKHDLDESQYGRYTEKAKDLLCKINTYYFDGTYTEIYKLKKENKKVFKLLEENNTKGYSHEIISVENKDQTSLIIEK